jgi:triosephosphate isomerase
MVGTGWKMNLTVAQTRAYAAELRPLLATLPTTDIDMFVLPPFTSLWAAREAFAGVPVEIGGQNMHWDVSGAWTGEISALMLVEAGCRYVELGHSERLAHFNETYGSVRLKVNSALATGLTPILCLGETDAERLAGRADQVLAAQAEQALGDTSPDAAGRVVFAYEPRWAIGAAAAAPVDYVADRLGSFRDFLGRHFGGQAATRARILYGGSVTPTNGANLVSLADVDGLFVGRAAWTAQGFAEIARIVAAAADTRIRV